MSDIEGLIPGVQKNVCLAPYTTFRVGGPADYFVIGETEDVILQTLKAVRQERLPLFVLAGGSNVLFSDDGFRGLVLLMRNAEYEISGETVLASAGASMADLIRETAGRGLAGLEWAGGLPGTLGGAIRGNAGAFGGEMKDSVAVVRYVTQTGEVRDASLAECTFAYRSSFFKTHDVVIISATLRMTTGDPALIAETARGHVEYRSLRHPLDLPNAGSIFKNVPFSSIPENLKERVRGVIKADPFPVIPAAYLIAQAGFAGKSIGDAQVSEKHTNFIVNRGRAASRDIAALISMIKKTVHEQFSVDLEVEIQCVA